MIVGFDELQSMSGERTAAKVIAISETGPRFDGRVMIGGEVAATFYGFNNGDPQHSNEVPVPDAVVDEYGPITYLCSVEVEPRHRLKGVMRQVVSFVSDMGRPVVIYPVPLIDPDPTSDEIEALRGSYSRMGFVPVEAQMMILRP